MKIEFKGFIPASLLDWDGKIVSTLFVPRCNYRCPYCQNVELVLSPEKLETVRIPSVTEYLSRKKDWIDGVCLTGGEPCLYDNLGDFCREIRHLDMQVKLDTNGSVPELLEELIRGNLVDYVAMDIKAPLDATAYERSTGIECTKNLKKVGKSVKMLLNSGIDYEFRTTVVPTLHTEEDVAGIASSIRGAKRYILQNFSNRETLNPEFSGLNPFPDEMLLRMRERAASFIKEVAIRGNGRIKKSL